MSCVQREVKKRAKKARTVSLYSLLGWGHMPLLGVKPQLALHQDKPFCLQFKFLKQQCQVSITKGATQ